MKNFPHQFANLDKLTSALRLAREVIENGESLGSNADYGDALAQGGVYGFRDEGDINALLAAEQEKGVSNQGTRTAAREMRRFLALCGFLERVGEDWDVTPRGAELLAETNPETQAALWREAMFAVRLAEEDGPASHPYRIMLKLVADNPGLETRKLFLAFEAEDDTAAEYQRVSALVDMEFADILAATQVTEANARNAVKILPSIAEQLGDVRRERKQTYPVGVAPVAEDGAEFPAPALAVKRTTPNSAAAQSKITRTVDAATIAATPEFQPPAGTTKDMTATIELQQRRTKQHQELMRRFAAHLVSLGFDLFEYPFDCLARREGRAILVEAKTLDGSPSDERRQAEKALGQIRGYAHFDLPGDLAAGDVSLLVLFSARPSDEMISFINANDLAVVWPDGEGWVWSDLDGIEGEFGG